MKSIGNNRQALDYLRNELTILDSTVTEIKIYTKDNVFTIDICFELLRIKKIVLLTFTNIKEYAFYSNHTTGTYYVERLKFFVSDGLIYLSTDPYDENETILETDNDFILAANVEGFIIEKLFSN